MWYLAASAIGFIVGATNGFLLNRRWTFREHVGDALTPVRWAIVQGCGLALNEGLLYLFVHDAHLDKLLAQACATAIVTVTRSSSTAPGPSACTRPWRWPTATSEPALGPRRRAHGPAADRAQRNTASSDSPAGMRPPRAISARLERERPLEQPVAAAPGAPTGRGSTRSSSCSRGPAPAARSRPAAAAS